MTASFFIDLISGSKRGPLANLLRGGFTLAEPFYACGSGLRNILFDRGLKRIHSAAVPVISIGNITTGGTGKTPTVAWLVKRLQKSGAKPGILSRGYQSLDGNANDEKLLLNQLCPDVPHVQNRERIAGAGTLLESHDCDVIVLDDGFQHRRLHRNFDLVLIDALNPWGYNHLLPRGLLRESLQNLKRAGAILITRCDQVSDAHLEELQQQLKLYTECPVITSLFAPMHLVNASGDKVKFNALNGKRTCSFAGIGNPNGFRRTLASIGLAVSDERFKIFPDHHHFTKGELQEIEQWASGQYAESLIVTRKDLVKINTDRLGTVPIWAVDIELIIEESEPSAKFLSELEMCRNSME